MSINIFELPAFEKPAAHHTFIIKEPAMDSKISDLAALRDMVCTFALEREWGQFHTPKNLAAALSVEAAELLEPFQWLATGDGPELTDIARAEVRLEMADVLAYLLLLADRLDVDLRQALEEKIAINAKKYPVDKARGRSEKYTTYEGK